MDSTIEERVQSWDSRPLQSGYAGLQELSSSGFSGAVRARGVWLFMLNGRVVGTFGGDIDAFEEASGTAFEAPHPALPLLFTMQQNGGEQRAQYYTNDTSIAEVDQQLTSGGFTGYVELSENVLSGDYYQVYYGGRSMSVAYVGSAEQLLTDEEAFQRADDEVGIYDVIDADIEVVDIPEPDDGDEAPDETASPAATGDRDSDRDVDSDDSEDRSPDRPDPVSDEQATPGTDPSDTASESADDAAATATSGPSETSDTESPTDAASDDAPGSEGASPDPKNDPEPRSEGSTTPDDRESAVASDDTGDTDVDAGVAEPDPATDPEPTVPEDTTDRQDSSRRDETPRPESGVSSATTGATGRSTAATSQLSSETNLQDANAIPSLDPDRTEIPGGRTTTDSSDADPSSQGDSGTTTARSASARSSPRGSGLNRADYRERIDALETERDDLEAERDRLERELSDAREENDSLRDEIDRLETEIEELEATIDRQATAGSDAGTATSAATGQNLSPDEALSGTDLFVRYDSKGKPTLEAARESGAEQTAVNENLYLDYHTRFETDEVVVEGRPFDEFLRSTMEFRFVEWVVRTLFYEIRETGQQSALRDLYDAVPEIDRVDFHGSVEVEPAEDEDDEALSERFDVVARNRMGQPLFVARLNDSREPATGGMMINLQKAATRVKDVETSLCAAFSVTRSFFEPSALETAAEATSGSFLSRDSRKSYVKISRKQGYHLCLVEARDDDLHLTVPEL